MKKINLKNVKKITLIMSVFFLGFTVLKSQMVVKDVEANVKLDEQKIKLVQQLKNAVEQTEKLQNMVETAKKNLDFIEQINNEVKNVSRIRQVAKLQSEVINEAFALKRKYKSTKDLNLALAVEQSTNSILENTKLNLNELSRILSAGTYNMNDAERLNEIRYQEKDLQNQRMQIEELRKLVEQYEFAMNVYNMK